jgi:hypothetical protein
MGHCSSLCVVGPAVSCQDIVLMRSISKLIVLFFTESTKFVSLRGVWPRSLYSFYSLIKGKGPLFMAHSSLTSALGEPLETHKDACKFSSGLNVLEA